jgi:hypothetical protein
VFLGQEAKPEPTLIDKSPQKSYSVIVDGHDPEFINADYVSFTPGHVTFWMRTPDAKQDTLVTCIRNEWVDEMKEVDFQ